MLHFRYINTIDTTYTDVKFKQRYSTNPTYADVVL